VKGLQAENSNLKDSSF